MKKSNKPSPTIKSPALIRPASEKPDNPRFFQNTRLQSVLIFSFAFLLYANTLGHQWAQDDTVVITDNALTQKGLSGIPDIFSKDTFFGYFKIEGKADVVSGGRYRPLTVAMFAVVYQFFGKNPFPFHLLTVISFAFVCLLLYRCLLLLLRDYRENGYVALAAWMATVLFVAHPVHTEVVANVKGCDEIFTLLGSLGALYLTLKAFDTGKLLYGFAAAVSMFLGLLAKENAVTFLAVIPLSLLFFRKATWAETLKNSWPLLLAFGVFFVMRMAVLPDLFSEPPMEILNNPYLKWSGEKWIHFTAGEKFATIFYTLGRYVQLLFVPLTLTHDYYPKNIDAKSFSDPEVLGSLALYVLLAGYAIFGLLKGKRDLLRFGILFYLATLSIVSNLVFPIGTHMGERFVFMPSIGFCLAVSFLLLAFSRSSAGFDFQKTKLPLFLFAATVLLFSIKTILRNQDWYDNKTLFFKDVKTSPNSAKLHAACGVILYQEGAVEPDAAKKTELFRRALSYSDKAIQIHPTYKSAWLNRGVANYYLKNYDAAIVDSRRALELASGDKKALTNLSLALCGKARYYHDEKNDLVTALNLLTESYQSDNSNEEAIWFLGIVNGKSGKHDQAIDWLSKFTALRPNDPAAWTGLEWAYKLAGNSAKAEECRIKAAALTPKKQ